MEISNMELAAFNNALGDEHDGYEDSYEPISVSSFDPSAMRVENRPKDFYQSPKETEDGQLTITVTRYNTSGSPGNLPFQLFGAMFGIFNTEDSNFFPNVVPFSAELTDGIDSALRDGIQILFTSAGEATYAAFAAAVIAAAPAFTTEYNLAFDGKRAIWLSDGSLQIGNSTQGVIIQCQEVPYKLLISELVSTTMMVRWSKFSYTTQLSLDREWIFQDKSFLGKIDQNQWIPRAYFSAMQFQSLITEIKASYWITPERAMNIVMDAAETNLSFVLYVSRFKKNALGAGHEHKHALPKSSPRMHPRKPTR